MEEVIEALVDEGLPTYELKIHEQNGKLWLVHPEIWPRDTLSKYASALAKAGITPIYHEELQAWEVEG